MNEGYFVHASSVFGADEYDSILEWILHVAIFANSHSVIFSKGRNNSILCIHPSSRAFAIYQIYFFPIFPSTSLYPLVFPVALIPFVSRISMSALAREKKV